MEITTAQVKHFQTHGFFFIPNPFGEKRMREIEQITVGKCGEMDKHRLAQRTQ